MDWEKASVELTRKLDPAHVKQRTQGGSGVSYGEGWHAIAEMNRIFGFGAWDRQTLDIRQLGEPRDVSSKIRVDYMARVRVTVTLENGRTVTRDGWGFGQGIDRDVGQVHESTLKDAETDAMKRAMMTFGNPAKGVSLLKSDADPREAWPQDKINAFRKVATGRALLIFELCLGTGQRIGDVLKMRWSDIESNGINVQQGKTKAKLWVPLTPRLADILKATPRIGMTICAWGTAGKATSYRGAADMVLEVRRQIGAEAYDLHGLCYSAAAEPAAAGCSDEMIMAITGHKTSAMVARYAGRARQKARATEAQERRK
ncbi:Rad52/Rad22 family DNA repair protein [Falsirhodobacter sp. 1013]|uniref:Rad52/Rad22 family DNA repair protein n=1 Tax=Falsirhodobacter sp. 1013 TaxID=3417566 RepID=UPI003EC10C6F